MQEVRLIQARKR